MMDSPHIAILMGTYDGSQFLPLQLTSILYQSHQNWSLWVSDDGSTDGTRELLESVRQQWGSDRVHILDGPSLGFVHNYLSLLCRHEIKADYFAFADQDDVWLPDKLWRSVEALGKCPPGAPGLYCGRTLIVDAEGVERGMSLLDRVMPSFPNALIQNIASGNTMVLNAAARDLMKYAGADVDIFAHDWWAYLAVMAVGGSVMFDPVPWVHYRQHGMNQVGASVTLGKLIRRTKLDRNGHLRSTFRRNVAALERIRHRITPENLALLEQVGQLGHPHALVRLAAFLRLPFKRQRLLGNCSLALAVLLGRL